MADQRVAPNVRLVDATTLTQGLAIDSSGRITIASIATSIVPGTAATHLGKAEDAASASGDTGVFLLAIQKATPADLAGSDGDYAGLQMSAGRLWASVVNETGTNSIGKISDITTSVVPGGGATHLGKAEDAAHTSGDTGVFVLAVRNDSHVALTSTDLDYSPISVNDKGQIDVNVISGGGSVSPTNGTWDITNIGTPVSIAAGASSNLDSGSLDAKYLWGAYISGSVAFKAVLATIDNASVVNKVVFFGDANNPVVFRPPPGAIQVPAAGAGTQGLRVVVTNLDTSETADFYASFFCADNAG